VTAGADLADHAAFKEAFAAHHRAMYGAAYRVLGDAALAQDAVQDVFLRIWRRPEAFDPSRGDLGAYLRMMARSRAVDLWREGHVRSRAAEKLEPPAECEDDHPVLHADLRSAVRRLPFPQREALVLAYWGGMTATQIAERMEVPLGTAKSRLRLGLARLREEAC
jgi:RNA polymerase sigma-70 factor (ECF subfamily)